MSIGEIIPRSIKFAEESIAQNLPVPEKKGNGQKEGVEQESAYAPGNNNKFMAEAVRAVGPVVSSLLSFKQDSAGETPSPTLLRMKIIDLRAAARSGNASLEQLLQLDWYVKADQVLSVLEKIHYEKLELSNLVAATRKKILTGVLEGNSELYNEAIHDLQLLYRGQVIEQVEKAKVAALRAKYPTNSHKELLFRLDYTQPNLTSDIKPYEASLEVMEALPIVKTGQVLGHQFVRNKKSPEMLEAEKKLAMHIGNVMVDIRNDTTIYVGSIQDLEKRVQYKEEYYAGPQIDEFLSRVELTEVQEGVSEEAQQDRIAFEDSLANLQDLSNLQTELQGSLQNPEGITSTVLRQARERILERSAVIEKRLRAEVQRIREEETTKRPWFQKLHHGPQVAGFGKFFEKEEVKKGFAKNPIFKSQPHISQREKAAQAKLDKFLIESQATAKSLEILDQNNPLVVPLGLAALQMATSNFIEFEEIHTRTLLSKDMESIGATGKDYYAPAQFSWDMDYASGLSSAPARIEKYLHIRESLDIQAFSNALHLKMKMIDNMVKTAKGIDSIGDPMEMIKNPLKTITNPHRLIMSPLVMMQDKANDWFLGGEGGDILPAYTKEYRPMQEEYRALMEKWEAYRVGGHPDQLAAIRSRFLDLERANQWGELNKEFGDITSFDNKMKFATNVAVVLLSAGTASVATGLLAPSVLRTSWSGIELATINLGRFGKETITLGRLALGTTNATVFTAAHPVWGGMAEGGLSGAWAGIKGIGAHPLAFAEESLLNGMMFGGMGGVLRIYMRGVSLKAIQNLSAKGIPATAEAIAKETLEIHEGLLKTKAIRNLTAKGAPISEQAVKNEVARLRKTILQNAQDFLKGGAIKVGAFGSEWAYFQVFEFLKLNYYLAKQGKFDPGLAADLALFNGEAWTEGFFFLIALKIGNLMALPITQTLHAKTQGFMLARHQKHLVRIQAVDGEIQEIQLQIQLERLDSLEAGSGSVRHRADLDGLSTTLKGRLQERAQLLEELASQRPQDPVTASALKATQEMVAQIEAWEATERADHRLIGEGNEFGVKYVGDGVATFSAAKGAQFIEALMAHPDVVEVEVSENGRIISVLKKCSSPIDPSASQEAKTFRFRADGEVPAVGKEEMKRAITGQASTAQKVKDFVHAVGVKAKNIYNALPFRIGGGPGLMIFSPKVGRGITFEGAAEAEYRDLLSMSGRMSRDPELNDISLESLRNQARELESDAMDGQISPKVSERMTREAQAIYLEVARREALAEAEVLSREEVEGKIAEYRKEALKALENPDDLYGDYDKTSAFEKRAKAEALQDYLEKASVSGSDLPNWDPFSEKTLSLEIQVGGIRFWEEYKNISRRAGLPLDSLGKPEDTLIFVSLDNQGRAVEWMTFEEFNRKEGSLLLPPKDTIVSLAINDESLTINSALLLRQGKAVKIPALLHRSILPQTVVRSIPKTTPFAGLLILRDKGAPPIDPQDPMAPWKGWEVTSVEENRISVKSPDGKRTFTLEGESFSFEKEDRVDLLPSPAGGSGGEKPGQIQRRMMDESQGTDSRLMALHEYIVWFESLTVGLPETVKAINEAKDFTEKLLYDPKTSRGLDQEFRMDLEGFLNYLRQKKGENLELLPLAEGPTPPMPAAAAAAQAPAEKSGEPYWHFHQNPPVHLPRVQSGAEKKKISPEGDEELSLPRETPSKPIQPKEPVYFTDRDLNKYRLMTRGTLLGDLVQNIQKRRAAQGDAGPPISVLELGAGKGIAAKELKEELGEKVRVETNDINPLEKGRSDKHRQGDFLNIDFKGRQYGLILSVYGPHAHNSGPAGENRFDAMLDKVFRLLKPNGEFFAVLTMGSLPSGRGADFNSPQFIERALQEGWVFSYYPSIGGSLLYIKKIGNARPLTMKKLLADPKPRMFQDRSVDDIYADLKEAQIEIAGITIRLSPPWIGKEWAVRRVAEKIHDIGIKEFCEDPVGMVRGLLEIFVREFQEKLNRLPNEEEIITWMNRGDLVIDFPFRGFTLHWPQTPMDDIIKLLLARRTEKRAQVGVPPLAVVPFFGGVAHVLGIDPGIAALGSLVGLSVAMAHMGNGGFWGRFVEGVKTLLPGNWKTNDNAEPKKELPPPTNSDHPFRPLLAPLPKDLSMDNAAGRQLVDSQIEPVMEALTQKGLLYKRAEENKTVREAMEEAYTLGHLELLRYLGSPEGIKAVEEVLGLFHIIPTRGNHPPLLLPESEAYKIVAQAILIRVLDKAKNPEEMASLLNQIRPLASQKGEIFSRRKERILERVDNYIRDTYFRTTGKYSPSSWWDHVQSFIHPLRERLYGFILARLITDERMSRELQKVELDNRYQIDLALESGPGGPEWAFHFKKGPYHFRDRVVQRESEPADFEELRSLLIPLLKNPKDSVRKEALATLMLLLQKGKTEPADFEALRSLLTPLLKDPKDSMHRDALLTMMTLLRKWPTVDEGFIQGLNDLFIALDSDKLWHQTHSYVSKKYFILDYLNLLSERLPPHHPRVRQILKKLQALAQHSDLQIRRQIRHLWPKIPPEYLKQFQGFSLLPMTKAEPWNENEDIFKFMIEIPEVF